MPTNASSRQVGGDHYAGAFQHWDLLPAVGFGREYYIGCATKYVARHHKKNGRQDLEKACHFVEKLIELCGRTDYVVRPPHCATLGMQYNRGALEEFFVANDMNEREFAVERLFISLLINGASITSYESALKVCRGLADDKYPADAQVRTEPEAPSSGDENYAGFVCEGYAGNETNSVVYWQCVRCGAHFVLSEGEHPGRGHVCVGRPVADPGSAPGPGYVDQARDKA